jgi:hypothetical protein
MVYFSARPLIIQDQARKVDLMKHQLVKAILIASMLGFGMAHAADLKIQKSSPNKQTVNPCDLGCPKPGCPCPQGGLHPSPVPKPK